MKVLATKANLSYHFSKPTAGFTLVEVLVVVVMVGVLATIVGPSWLGFVNRQRANKANDVIFAALQEAQREAKNTKLSYSVSFKNDGNIAQIAVHQGTSPSNWRNLGEELGIKPGQFKLLTNLTANNTAGASVNLDPNYLNTAQTITFDYTGNLTNPALGTSGIKIVVASNHIKRCVIVRTLLGAMVTQKDNKCS